jgi:hypothetical protein
MTLKTRLIVNPGYPVPAVGSKIPPITLTAAGSGRKLNLDRLEVPAVLFFLWRDTLHLAEPVNLGVRRRYPLVSQLLVANLADLRGVPGLLHGLVSREMNKGYHDIAARLPADLNPADYVLIIPDWKGKAVKAVGLPGPLRRPALAVIGRGGVLLGVHQGDDLAEAALRILEPFGI